jgi:hypothetical protein
METATTETPEPVTTSDAAIEEINGKSYMRDARGALVPEELVRDTDKLIDQSVRAIMRHAQELSARIARFKGHTHDDVASLRALLAEKYEASLGGKKGNLTLTSHDGTMKVQVQIQDHITFGPELEIAKGLVDECISGWSEDARPELRALVEHAFQVDKQGRINRAALYQLRRLDIEDESWKGAMTALTDSMRVIGTSTYLRFYARDTAQGQWRAVPIDIAAV